MLDVYRLEPDGEASLTAAAGDAGRPSSTLLAGLKGAPTLRQPHC